MAHGLLEHANGHAKGCGCGCGCTPGEFVRVRYFYGQLLGATDLLDEQAYMVGKHRFHNTRLHGWGVLCGLRAERGPTANTEESEETTIIRVLRGAAVDHCGNEIVVPGDYCIDVNAWFLANKAKAAKSLVAAGTGGEIPTSGVVYVVVRYQECPSEPAFAPRDPCGCDEGGCEYARVRETFKLDLITADQVKDVPQDPPFPLEKDGTGLEALVDPTGAALREATSAPCPVPCKGGWLVLAEVVVTIETDGSKITDVSTPDNTTELRRVLLSTSALQAAALAGFGSAWQAGPSILGAQALSATSIGINLQLYTEDGASAANAVVPESLAPGVISVARLGDPNPGWNVLAVAAAPAPAVAAALISFALDPAGALAPGQIVRIAVKQDAAAPVCDETGRSLSPVTWARTYIVGGTAAAPTLDDLAS